MDELRYADPSDNKVTSKSRGAENSKQRDPIPFCVENSFAVGSIVVHYWKRCTDLKNAPSSKGVGSRSKSFVASPAYVALTKIIWLAHIAIQGSCSDGGVQQGAQLRM